MTGKEVAEVTGVSERTIQRHASRSNNGTVTIKGSVYHFKLIDGVGGRGEVYEIWIGENDETGTQSSITDDTGDRGTVKRGADDNLDRPKRAKRVKTSSGQTNATGDERNSLTNDPREAAKLTEEERERAELKCHCVIAYTNKPKGMNCEAFIAEIGIAYESLAVTKTKLNRWLGEYKKAKKEGRNVIVSLADKRGRPKGITVLSTEMKEMIVRYVLRKDVHLNVSGIYANMLHAFGDTLPSRNTVERYINEWKKSNALQWEIRLNPDRAKSYYQPAHGSRSEHITYKNQVWELDGTVADVVTADGRRWLIVGTIDVYSRRVVMSLEESNTSFALARNIRKAILKLGVPDGVLTDNGKDYTSNHFSSVCLSLGIEQKLTHPYSGDQKPHIERFFGTMARELFRSIEGFCGHSVVERQAIQSSLSFEQKLNAIEKWKAKAHDIKGFEALFKKRKELVGLSIEVPLLPKDLEQWIDRWVNALYERSTHKGIKTTPIKRWESDFTPAKNVGNIRSLDFLMGKSEYRTINKKGIVITRDGITGEYHHPCLAGMTGEKVLVLEPDEMGEVCVYTQEREFLCVAIDPTLKGQSRESSAAITKAYKKEVRTYLSANKKADELAKQLKDPLVTDRIIEAEVRYGLGIPEIRIPKQTPEIIGANAAVEVKEEELTLGVRKYASYYERFYEKLITHTWSDKDTVLAEKFPSEYKRAVNNVKKTG